MGRVGMVPTQFADFGRVVDSAGQGCPERTRSRQALPPMCAGDAPDGDRTVGDEGRYE